MTMVLKQNTATDKQWQILIFDYLASIFSCTPHAGNNTEEKHESSFKMKASCCVLPGTDST